MKLWKFKSQCNYHNETLRKLSKNKCNFFFTMCLNYDNKYELVSKVKSLVSANNVVNLLVIPQNERNKLILILKNDASLFFAKICAKNWVKL